MSNRERDLPGAEQESFITHRIVIKIGSNVLTEGATADNPLNTELIDSIARQCSHLYKNGVDVIIVSSGAVACGRHLLSIEERSLQDRQVEALYGQPTLIGTWVQAFKKYRVIVGQALITENDLEEAQKVLQKSFKSGVIIVNANDAVSVSEMQQFLVSADNDRLAGFVAETIEADTIILLTDVDGVLDSKGRLIEDGFRIDNTIQFRQGSDRGTGGMRSKVETLRELASNTRIRGVIASAKQEDVILEIARGNTKGRGTIFQV